MTVSSDTGYFSSLGNGVTTEFPFAAALLTGADLIVELVDTTTGDVTDQVEAVDYTLTIASDWQSGTVTFLDPPPAGQRVVRRRKPNFLQEAKMRTTGRFPALAVEQAVDRIVMSMQAVRDAGNRGIRLADSDPPDLAALPPLEQLIGKFLYIGLDGRPGATDGPGDVPIDAAMVPFVQSASIADALTELGLSAYFQTLLGTASLAAMKVALEIGDGLIRSYLAGLVTSNDGVAPNTKINVSAGFCADSGNAAMMTFAAGSIDCTIVGASGLDAGALANNTWYHTFAISKADGSRAFLASTSVAAPALPAGYTLKRRIGSFRTDGAAHIIPFVQDGDVFSWVTPRLDLDAFNIANTNATLHTLAGVPLGLRVQARLSALYLAASAGYPVATLYVSDPSTTDQAPVGPNGGAGTSPLFTTASQNSAGANAPMALMDIFTNTSQQVRSRASSSGAGDFLYIATRGWIDRRGRDD